MDVSSRKRLKSSTGTASASTGSSAVAGRRARFAVDRGQLPEQVTRATDREHDLLAVVAQAAELDAPAEQHEHPVGRSAARGKSATPRGKLRTTPRATERVLLIGAQ